MSSQVSTASALPIQPTRQPTILVVEDHEDNLLLLTHVLEQLAYNVVATVDGETALMVAQNCNPNLIILDILLPDLNGIDLISQLRQHPSTHTVPIIAVTALARADDRKKILQAGSNAYLSKPYMLSDLEATVQNYLKSN